MLKSELNPYATVGWQEAKCHLEGTCVYEDPHTVILEDPLRRLNAHDYV